LAKYNLIDPAKDDEMGRALSMNGDEKHTYRKLVGKPEGRILL
jgi:hypothetical protein